jgi:hypothetical protein
VNASGWLGLAGAALLFAGEWWGGRLRLLTVPICTIRVTRLAFGPRLVRTVGCALLLCALVLAFT